MSDSAGAPQDVGDVIITDDATMRRAVAAAAIGNVTEWYDFGVYSYLAESAIKNVFFDPAGEYASIITLGVFAVSFLVRPIGGLFFGPLGDRIGRTKVLSITVILMAAGTFLLGCVPSYASIGLAAPILVLVIRLIQGFSTGGEYGGAMTFIAEYSADRKRGFFGSWLEFGTLTGYAMGAAISTLLVATLPTPSLLSWGWRIPFMIALPLGVIGLYLRTKLEETPAFQQLLDQSESREQQGTPAGKAFKLIFTKHWRSVLVAGGLVTAWNVTNYVLTNYVPTYTTGTLKDAGLESVSGTTSNGLQIGVLLVLIVVITFIGRLSDRIGRKPILYAGSIALIFLGWPSVLLLQQGFGGQIGGLMIMGLSLVMFSSICPSTLPALFPTEIRYGGLSITFNLFVSAFAGTAATVIGAMVALTGDLNWPGYYLIGAGVVGLVSCYFLIESAGKPLEGSKPAVASEEEARELIAAGKT